MVAQVNYKLHIKFNGAIGPRHNPVHYFNMEMKCCPRILSFPQTKVFAASNHLEMSDGPTTELDSLNSQQSNICLAKQTILSITLKPNCE